MRCFVAVALLTRREFIVSEVLASAHPVDKPRRLLLSLSLTLRDMSRARMFRDGGNAEGRQYSDLCASLLKLICEEEEEEEEGNDDEEEEEEEGKEEVGGKGVEEEEATVRLVAL
jgi:hypothetical protein